MANALLSSQHAAQFEELIQVCAHAFHASGFSCLVKFLAFSRRPEASVFPLTRPHLSIAVHLSVLLQKSPGSASAAYDLLFLQH